MSVPAIEPGEDGLGSSAARKARLHIARPPGQHSALWYFPQFTGGYLRVARNALVGELARFAPWMPLKNAMYRLLGARVAPHAAIGYKVVFDIFYPEDVTVGEDTIIGYNTTILCHEVTRHEWRRAPVWIGRDVTVGANSTILPGVVIGDGATISAMSLVNRDVPAGAFVGGVPVRLLNTGQGRSSQ